MSMYAARMRAHVGRRVDAVSETTFVSPAAERCPQHRVREDRGAGRLPPRGLGDRNRRIQRCLSGRRAYSLVRALTAGGARRSCCPVASSLCMSAVTPKSSATSASDASRRTLLACIAAIGSRKIQIHPRAIKCPIRVKEPREATYRNFLTGCQTAIPAFPA